MSVRGQLRLPQPVQRCAPLLPLYPRIADQVDAQVKVVSLVPLSAARRCKRVSVHSGRNAVKTFGLWSHHEITHGLNNDAGMRAHRIVPSVIDPHNRQILDVLFKAVEQSG